MYLQLCLCIIFFFSKLLQRMYLQLCLCIKFSSQYQFFTKLISGNNEPFTAVFYTAILGALVFTIYISFNWVPIENNLYWIGLILMGIFGFLSHFIIIYAIQLSNLSFVTNFQYSQLLWSTVINFLIFGVPFDVNKILGVIGIIIFGILFIRTEGSRKN